MILLFMKVKKELDNGLKIGMWAIRRKFKHAVKGNGHITAH